MTNQKYAGSTAPLPALVCSMWLARHRHGEPITVRARTAALVLFWRRRRRRLRLLLFRRRILLLLLLPLVELLLVLLLLLRRAVLHRRRGLHQRMLLRRLRSLSRRATILLGRMVAALNLPVAVFHARASLLLVGVRLRLWHLADLIVLALIVAGIRLIPIVWRSEGVEAFRIGLLWTSTLIHRRWAIGRSRLRWRHGMHDGLLI